MSLQVVVNFRVIDETDDWVVVDKPAPLIVHPANNKPEPTLLGGLQKLYSYEIQNGASLGIVTRLDRETSGLVLVAKHTAAARELGMIFQRREAHKEYLALVTGWPNEDEWTADEKICRGIEIGLTDIWVRQVVDDRGKDCSTRFIVELRFERNGVKYALIHCFPKTGRMHQIRVHLQASGFPILGDKLYSGEGNEYLEWLEKGWNRELAQTLIMSRHALHSARLGMVWKGSHIFWEAQLAEDMRNFIAGAPVDFPDGIVIWSSKE